MPRGHLTVRYRSCADRPVKARSFLRKTTARLSLCLCLTAACAADDEPKRRAKPDASAAAEADASADAEAAVRTLDPAGFCTRDDADEVRDVFCAERAPITSLSELQRALNVYPHAPNPRAPYVGDPMLDNPHAAVSSVLVMSHSTSLSGQLVSPINPRVLILSENTIMAFSRGVQRVELISLSRTTNQLNFYMLSFEQACNASEAGCTPGDLYTPQIETDWTGLSVRDAEELKNTPLDCRQCHQRNSSEPSLLMRELEGPWTHFFLPADLEQAPQGVSGSDLMRDYLAAKGDELYAGYELSTISSVLPFVFQRRVGGIQPLNFDSLKILNERFPMEDGGYVQEAQPSPTWEEGYEAFKRGDQLPLPYLDQRATDPDKQQQLTDAYRRYRDGELDAAELPDLADIYPDDDALRARMGLQTEAEASAEDALIQACGSCHNDVLDQSLSRARFNIDVSRIDSGERELAIDRIMRPHDAPGVMPPPEARQLHPAALEKLVEYLREEREEDPRLVHAASMGMTGGGIATQIPF
jgi:hypothetical protein